MGQALAQMGQAQAPTQLTCTSTSTNSFAHVIMTETRMFLLVMPILEIINLQNVTVCTPKVTQICMLL